MFSAFVRLCSRYLKARVIALVLIVLGFFASLSPHRFSQFIACIAVLPSSDRRFSELHLVFSITHLFQCLCCVSFPYFVLVNSDVDTAYGFSFRRSTAYVLLPRLLELSETEIAVDFFEFLLLLTSLVPVFCFFSAATYSGRHLVISGTGMLAHTHLGGTRTDVVHLSNTTPCCLLRLLLFLRFLVFLCVSVVVVVVAEVVLGEDEAAAAAEESPAQTYRCLCAL